MPKRLKAILKDYCVLELDPAWLSRLAEKFAMQNWVVDLEIVDAVSIGPFDVNCVDRAL